MGDVTRILDNLEVTYEGPPDDLLAIDEALTKLEREDPPKAKLVQLRFFAGLTHEQAAEVLGVSVVTAKRYWRYARAWLHRELQFPADSQATS